MDGLLGAVWLYSADVERAARFYEESVGLRPVGREGDVAHFDCGNIRLSLHPGTAAVGGFLVFVVDDAAAEHTAMRARGVEFVSEPHREEFGGLVAEFRDPDGHELYIWQLPDDSDPAWDDIRPLADHYGRLRAALET